MDWYTVDTIGADWPDAPTTSASVLQQLVDAGKQQVLAFDNGYTWANTATLNTDVNGAPVAYPGDYPAGAVPSNLVLAHRMQIRNLWNAAAVDPSNASTTDDTFIVRPFPLDWMVRQIIRPKTGGLGFVA